MIFRNCHQATKYRSRTDIVAQILQVANGTDNANKTRILYNVFLTHGQVKEYIAMLVQNGLLEYRKGTQTYKTTEKGLKFLKEYEQMQEELMSTTTTNSQIK